MARSLVHIVAPEDDGMRLDALAAARKLYPSRSAAVKAIEEGRVFVNGESLAKKAAVCAGDTIVYEVYEEAPRTHLVGQPIDLDIRYEDDYLIVLSKQVGLVCHPSPDHFDGTLVNALIYHCGADSLCNVQGERDRLGIVHRLDRDTSGLMLAAKTDEVGQSLMDDIRDRIVDRHYLALVQGVIPHDTGMIDAPIARADRERTRMAVSDSASARDSITTFTVLERFDAGPKDDGYTLVDCKLFTGRTHQIRVHMNYIKHACVGDPVYGSGSAAMQLGLTRQFLHSYRLAFTHPATGEDLEFVDGLPADLARALESISDRSRGRTEAGETACAAIGKGSLR
ncbi:RluA family pseudouridine synthase [Raoultibacter timonensis]|uniref:Pseudouridine synthase n=1 Tax=Raoultibacter timonensis TaxID=1907662 RepID=A0ABM7WJ23_9ACTN|nr:RluA family pseudouridine synthase [Raoultibacter timonensis]BDE96325.1 pseudouridine synthase [Raoultibacter timonensis]BDF50930.1 pseudouridine synthase [Raoultibacter timonensis]